MQALCSSLSDCTLHVPRSSINATPPKFASFVFPSKVRIRLSLTFGCGVHKPHRMSRCGCFGLQCAPTGGESDDGFYIRRCVELARKAIGFTSPNPLVGCVIVKDGNVVGEGFHPKAGQPHAEVTTFSLFFSLYIIIILLCEIKKYKKNYVCSWHTHYTVFLCEMTRLVW